MSAQRPLLNKDSWGFSKCTASQAVTPDDFALFSDILKLHAAEGLDGGPDEGGALGADSDEEEKRANRAKAASADQSSRVEARNQNTNADVSFKTTSSMTGCTHAQHMGCLPKAGHA